jgi:peptidoglycan/LPS O-acetylase OafA/YrhL
MYQSAWWRIMVGVERWRLGHRPALDGLRGVAILLVFLEHLGVPFLHAAGGFGVTMFFTLSGFLITAGLLEEREAAGSVSLARFYLRRATRLGPALVACVAFALMVEWVVVGRVRDWSLAAGALTWSSNFVMARDGWGSWADTPLSQTWSLSVEEQFYLLWPVLLLGLYAVSRRAAFAVTSVLVVGSLAIGSSGPVEHRYLMLDARAFHLLVGAMLAMALVGARRREVSARWAALPIGAIAAVVAFNNPAPGFSHLVAVLTVGLLYVLANSDVAVLEPAALRWLGERSYGVYLYHVPVLMLVGAATSPSLVRGASAVVITLALAAASYRWMERPVRTWGRSRAALLGQVREPRVAVAGLDDRQREVQAELPVF